MTNYTKIMDCASKKETTLPKRKSPQWLSALRIYPSDSPEKLTSDFYDWARSSRSPINANSLLRWIRDEESVATRINKNHLCLQNICIILADEGKYSQLTCPSKTKFEEAVAKGLARPGEIKSATLLELTPA